MFFLGTIAAIALAGLMAAPTAPQAIPSPPPIIEHGPRDSKMVALTFDACRTGLPDDFDGAVIDILMHEQVPATIFMSGKWVERNFDGAAFLAEQPQFEIANHSYWHPHLLEKDDATVLRELRRTQAVLQTLTGRPPRFFRSPYGEVDERIARLAAKVGLTTIQYDIASGDPDPKLRPSRIVHTILRDARGGSIIVFHVNRHGVHTAEDLPEIITGLRKKGFTLVTVGEMLKGQCAENGREKAKAQTIELRGPTSIETEEY